MHFVDLFYNLVTIYLVVADETISCEVRVVMS